MRFGARHFAMVVFVVHAGKMQQPVQHQNADFVHTRMAEHTRLGFRTLDLATIG